MKADELLGLTCCIKEKIEGLDDLFSTGTMFDSDFVEFVQTKLNGIIVILDDIEFTVPRGIVQDKGENHVR